MAGASTRDLIDRSWKDALRWLPGDIDALAITTGGMQKRRQIRTGAQLLRLAFAFGYAVVDFALRSTAAWAPTHG